MNKPRARLKDIAEATGFSANTVSLALRGSNRIPEGTRELILNEAKRLNYFPNHVARSLVSSATRTIGLIMTDIMNPTLTLAARTIERELSKARYAMMFAASDTSVEHEKRAIALLLSYQVDGMLIYPANHGACDHFRPVAEGGTPILLLAGPAGSGIDIVAIDDCAGAYKAARYLCETGRRRIAMLDGGQALLNQDKLKGARRAVRESGLPEDALKVFSPGGHSAAHGYACMERVMGTTPVPNALFASTDALAAGALRWCREHGVNVPGELAIVGYDNTEIAEFNATPLTTVNYAADEISRIGVDRLLKRINENDPASEATHQLIEPHLIIRDTA
jgi:LacI family transcriptional regulator